MTPPAPGPNDIDADRLTGGQPRKIVVAMSGGVNSSVVAALLKSGGHDVIGVTLQLYDHGATAGRKGSCCAGQDIHDARRVAERLGIPHYVLDYERRFASTVIDRFRTSYVAGETPVPCVACNQEIKFGSFLATVQELGAELLATGHYIELRRGPAGPELYRAADAARDQSYFLFQTTRNLLGRLAFPLGNLRKAEVRALARDLALPIADKPDSQDICFVPSGGYAGTIERLRPEACKAGDIVDLEGRVLGRHKGIIHFTVGQRRGLGIAGSEPFFVIKLDAARQTVTIGPRAYLSTDEVQLRDVNWLGDADIAVAAGDGLDIHVRIRSTSAPQPAKLVRVERGFAVRLRSGEFGVSAGQACVFYADGSDRSRVLGGGWIASTNAPANRAERSPSHRAESAADGVQRPVLA